MQVLHWLCIALGVDHPEATDIVVCHHCGSKVLLVEQAEAEREAETPKGVPGVADKP